MKAPPDEASTCAPADLTPRPPTFTLPAGAVDCHAHVFLDPRAFPFHQPRSYTPPPALLEAYCAMHRTLGIARGVLVQPSVYGDDNSAQANALVSLRGQGLDYRGVAVVRGNVTDAELDRLGRIGFCGVRLNLLFEGGIAWADVVHLASRLAERNWHLQCLIDISTFPRLTHRLGNLAVPVVIDHMGHFNAEKGAAHPSFQNLLRLLDTGRAWVKLSGAYRLTRQNHPPYSDVQPLAEALVQANPQRLVWGSDWPHPHIRGAMPNDGHLLDLLAGWAPDQATRQAILVSNPEALYGFAPVGQKNGHCR
ncbi:amidohydrolase family protein [Pseudomonas sp. O39]|uniref:amidohydrolase family protein n=1 Tax=Pseudomonas sp. O39 TaxID=3379130 RepID=UPI00387AFEC9